MGRTSATHSQLAADLKSYTQTSTQAARFFRYKTGSTTQLYSQ